MKAGPKHSENSRRLLWAVLPPAALAFVLLILFATDTWTVVRVWPYGGLHFADLLQVTATADCVRAGSWTMESATCDPYSRPFNYPALWAHSFALLGLGRSSTDVVGYGLAVTLVGAVLILTISMRAPIAQSSFAILMTAVVVSPPFLLAAERGNIDIVVFLAVVVGTAAIASQRRLPGTAFLSLAVILKLYPVGALGSLLIGRSTRGPRYGPLLLAVVVTAAWLVAVAPELRLVLERTPQFMHVSYGAGVLPAGVRRVLGAGGPEVTLLDRLAGFILLAGTVAGLEWLKTRSRALQHLLSTGWVEELAPNRIAACFVMAGGGILVLSYAISVNYDYRLVFSSLVVAGLLATRPPLEHGLVTPIRLAGALTAALWLTFPMPGYSEYLGDLVLAVVVPYLVLVLVRLAVASLARGGRDRDALASSGRPG
jgi:hypothetical protein